MPNSTHGRMKAGRGVVVLAGFLAFAAIAFLTWKVAQEIRAQGSAASDNVQWSLSQSEVEFQEFYGRLRIGSDLAGIRRRFDIFYSRIETVSEAKVFADLREDQEFAARLANVRKFLEQTVKMIDGDDIALTSNIPNLTILSQNIRPEVRGLSNAGLKMFAERADLQRNTVARTLTQLAIALISLISALGLGVAFLVRLNRQVSERERQQVLSATRMNTIMNTSLDGVIVTNQDGQITGFSRAAEIIFGQKADYVMGKEVGQVIIPDHLRDAHEAGMERMRNGGEKRVVGKGRIRLEAKRSDGSMFPAELAIQSASTETGQIFIAFLRDVSQQVADEEELIEARDKAIAGEQSRSDFLATMSHEIRTPLNGLIGNMSLLRDTRLTAKQDTFLRNMETSGRLLMSHVSDVLDIARYDSGKINARSEAMNISTLIQDIVDNQSGMASANDTTLDWGWRGPHQNWITGDPDRLQHVLINLISNAVKFTKNGRVSITVSWNDEGTIHFDVEDTGVGIADNLKGRIFDDFVTGNTAYDRDVGGTGLGLSIVKRFVEAMDGDITVESELGIGSTFHVSLPTKKAEPVTETSETSTPNAVTKSMRILVVEDNEINRFVVRNMLVADGHSVTEANDGQQGVDLAFVERFDLILMDISMPVLDGRAATLCIREGNGASANAQIVALTANALAEERVDFLTHGMDGVLTKPLTKDALRAVLSGVGLSELVASTDLVDVAHNAETAVAAGVDAYPKLLSRFFADVDELITWLDPSRDLSEISGRSHNIAGSSALFGAFALRAALVALEDTAKTGAHGDLPLKIDAVKAVSQSTKRALTNLASITPE